MFERVLRGTYKSKIYKKSLRMSYLRMRSKATHPPDGILDPSHEHMAWFKQTFREAYNVWNGVDVESGVLWCSNYTLQML